MKTFSKSFDEMAKSDKNDCIYNLFLICSSISLIVMSTVAVIKLIAKISHICHHKYRYHYDVCDCSPKTDECGCDNNNCGCEGQ